jgi:D-lactate dehydrogenase
MDELPPAAAASLRELLPTERLCTDELTRTAFAPDASLYFLVPKAVVFPRTIAEIQQLFAWSRQYRIPLTFRAAGTSLSGQAVTDGVLVEVRRYWQRWELLENGRAVRAQPGVRAGLLNAFLRAYERRLGPDPASVEICTIGGIVANNSSGMCCGTRQTAYRTLRGLTCVLPNGLVLNTTAPDADAQLMAQAPELAQGLLRLRSSILTRPALRERIERKYRLKNTVGYSLNALVDFATPAQILAHLMVGSEGTLGFIAEVVLETVPDPPLRLTGFALFASPEEACRAVKPLEQLHADAVELLDRASLAAIRQRPALQPLLDSLPKHAAALLFEYQRSTPAELEELRSATEALFGELPGIRPPLLTQEQRLQQELWAARRSLYPAVAARRAPGTTPISEDIAVPVEALPETVRRLQQLFERFGYSDAVIFGHAKDGNLHFVLPQPLRSPADEQRYGELMEEVVRCVLEFGGSLKAEHGTGRNMAPFVRAEWGEEAYELMWAIKQLFDPEGILNPDVVLSRRERVHLQQLKRIPILHSEADRCMECGFCESFCPSRALTLTPRQRIALLRYRGSSSEQRWRYAVEDTCAGDGLCRLHCPVGIDTGALVAQLRARRHRRSTRLGMQWLARHFGVADATMRLLLTGSLRVARLLPSSWLQAWNRFAQRRSPRLPQWSPALRLPLPRLRRAPAVPEGATLYFPSCVVRWFGRLPQEPEDSLTVLQQLLQRAGAELVLLPEAERHCCGLFFTSRGFPEAAEIARARLLEAGKRLRARRLVVDGSSCAAHLRQHGDGALEILDLVQWLSTLALPIRRRAAEIALHIPCGARHQGIEAALLELAHRCAERVHIVLANDCCGAAGDRWLRYPELPASLLAHAAQLPREGICGYSSNPPCEMALQHFTGLRWLPLPRLLWWATQAESAPPAAQPR